MTLLVEDRRSGIEADAGVTGDERVVDEAIVARRVGHEEEIAGRGDRVGAEGDVAARLGHRHPHLRLEPLAVAIDQRHQRDRRAADLRRDGDEIVVDLLRRTVEDRQRFERGETIGLVLRCHGRPVQRAHFGVDRSHP